jgi:glycine/D-amino acid oxidase-like deaminating enzyme
MKVGVVGAGAVGTACMFAMALRGSAREIVLVNRSHERARGAVTDLQYGAVLARPVSLRAADYGELRGAASGRNTRAAGFRSANTSTNPGTGLERRSAPTSSEEAVVVARRPSLSADIRAHYTDTCRFVSVSVTNRLRVRAD